MSREIKFRAWDNRDKKFVATWFSVIGEVTMFGVIDEYCFETKSNDQTTLDRLGDIEIEQFTGLKDKNGVEIYEGDVLRVEFSPGNSHTGLVEMNQFRLSWSIKFGDYVNNDLYRYSRNGKTCEVIGNIHQNPELL